MAKLRVRRVELIAPVSQKEDVLRYLQAFGTLEVSSVTEEGFGSDSFSDETAALEANAARVNAALTALDKAVPEKKPLTAMLEPRVALSENEYLEKSKSLDEALEAAEHILKLESEKADLAADDVRLNTARDVLLPWVDVDLKDPEGTLGRVSYLIGSFRFGIDRETLLTRLASALPEIECVEAEILNTSAEMTAVAVYCLEEDAPEVEQALREIGFVTAPDCGDISPKEKLDGIDNALAANKARREEIAQELKDAAGKREELKFALDELSIRLDRYAAAEKTGRCGRVMLLKGYASEKDAQKIKTKTENKFDAAVELFEPAGDEDVPVILSNRGFASPLENITGMYSLPGKADIDPTGVMAFFYYFFFGMMLSDAGYGLLMVLATGGALLFKRNMEQKTRNSVKMYLFCGLSTMFWGAMYGSWFGDVGHVIMREFFGRDINPLPPLWTDAVSDTMNVLIMCFILGLAHLFWGVLMKGWTDIKNGHKLDAVFDTLPTIITVIGIAPIFFGLFAQDSIPEDYTPLGTFFFNIFTSVHNGLKSVSAYILIAGLVLVVATAGRHAKGVVGKLGGGLYAVYGLFSGYLGDVLSYARLLALGMATGVIAQVMNMLGTLPSNTAVKLLMFIPVFIVGHAANMAINLIGAYVHTNRLQYVEFFSKFYEGGGRAFTPFEAKTKYYRFKEEL